MSEQSPSRRPLALVLAAGVGIILVVIALLYWGRDEPLPPHDGLDGPRLEKPPEHELAAKSTAQPKSRNRDRDARKPKKTQAPDQPKAEAVRDEPSDAKPTPPEPFYADQKGSLEVIVRDGLESLPEAERPRYALILQPDSGIDPWLNTRLEMIRSGSTKITSLPAVDWTAHLLGDRMNAQIFSLLPGEKRTLEIGDNLLLRTFGPLRIDGVDAEGAAVNDLTLLYRMPGAAAQLVGKHESGSALLDLLVGPIDGELEVACSGYLSTRRLERATDPVEGQDLVFKDPTSGEILGTRFRQNFRVEFSARAFRLQGRVETQDGKALPEVQVVFVEAASAEAAAEQLHGPVGSAGADRAGTISARTNSQGRYSLDLPPNSSGFVIAISSGFAVAQSENLLTGQAEEKADLDLVLPAGRKVRGRGPIQTDDPKVRRACYGPIEDLVTRIKPAGDGSYLIQTAPRNRFGIGLFTEAGSSTATMTWSVEMDQPAAKALLTR